MTAADEEKDPQEDVKDEAPAKAAAKKPAAKKAAAEKPAAKEPVAERAVCRKGLPRKKLRPQKRLQPKSQLPSAAKCPPRKRLQPPKKHRPQKSPLPPRSPNSLRRNPRRRAGKAAEPKPRRRVVRAQARYVRTSARKARMVCGHLRGKSIPEARAILEFTPREVARDWSKLLESAVANAEINHELLEDDLIVREAYADEGPTIKRFRPRAMGRATPIRKRTSHLTITLTPDA